MASVQPPNPLPPDESVGGILLVLTSVLTTFTIVTTGLRLYARWRRHTLGWVRSTNAMIAYPALLKFDRMTMR